MAIDPKRADIGRSVLYKPRDGALAGPARGVITAVTDKFVFVRYGDDEISRPARRDDLEYLS